MPVRVSRIFLGCFLLLAASALRGQTFTSGSDGTDGALDYSNQPPGTYIFAPAQLPNPLPANHGPVYNFTYVTIPKGTTVRFSAQYLPGPVYLLAQQAVDIEGTFDLSGGAGYAVTNLVANRVPSIPGPGGFPGGVGGNGLPGSGVNYPAEPGQGPAGGQLFDLRNSCSAIYGGGGGFTGDLFLVPLIGGSGGAGTTYGGAFGSGGGAGGGAILIASSVSITVNGTITAQGGAANGSGEPAGGGAGGAIRLATVTIQGSGQLNVGAGGQVGSCSNNNPPQASRGTVRLEAFNQQFAGTISGTQYSGTPYNSFAPNNATSPQLTVVSVAGSPVAPLPLGNFDTPDVRFSAAGAVPIVLNGVNIPAGTPVSIDVFSENGPDITDSGTLATTSGANTTTTITVTIPPGFSRGYISATWTPTSTQDARKTNTAKK